MTVIMEYQVRSLVLLAKFEVEVVRHSPCASTDEPPEETSPWLYTPRSGLRRVSVNALVIVHRVSLTFPCHLGQKSSLCPYKLARSAMVADG